ncbi:MAG: CPBP family intramembrane glutamic endopeptidase [Candidatus Magasanikbacteria bacterium]
MFSKITTTQKTVFEIIFLLGLPIVIGSFLNLQTSNFVIFPFAILIMLRIFQLYRRGIITKEDDFQESKHIIKSFGVYSIFTVFALLVIFSIKDFLDLPYWLVNDEPWLFILLHAFLQELIYRTYLINRLKIIFNNTFIITFFGAFVFAGIHLLLPFSLTVIILTFISGFFWSFIYQKYPSLVFVTISHFLLNWVLISWF